MRLLLSALLLMIFTGRAAGQTLHLLLASDIEDAQFGMISLQDEERMTQLFGTVERGIGYTMKPIYFNKTKFTRDTIRDTIAKIKVQPDDIIVFFYSGLGYYPETSKSEFPFLQVKNWQKQPLSLEEVGTLLQAKKVRFCMAMADCRNESLVMEPKKVPNVSPGTVLKANYRKLFLKHLFLKKCGLMTIASASRNQNTLVVTTSEVDEKTLTELHRETGSLFTRLFAYEFTGMDIENLNSITQADFDTLLQRVQRSIPERLNITPERVQTLVWKTQPCEAAVRSKISIFPTFVFPQTPNELEKTLNQLIAIKETDKRKAIITILSDFYEFNSAVYNLEVSVYAYDLKRLRMPGKVSFKNYLESLTVFDSKLKKIEIKNTDSRDESIMNKNLMLTIWETEEPGRNSSLSDVQQNGSQNSNPGGGGPTPPKPLNRRIRRE